MYFYVYRITNKETNKHYYGSRKSKISPSKDLGVFYFSSSTNKSFIQEQKSKPEIYKYKILREFLDYETMLKFEVSIHNKFNVSKNEKFYNMQNQRKNGFTTHGNANYVWVDGRCDELVYCNTKNPKVISGELIHFKRGTKCTETHIENNRLARLGTKLSEETKEKLSKMRKGKKKPDGFGELISKRLKGVPKSDQHKENLRKANLGKKHSDITKEKLKNRKSSTKDKKFYNNGINCIMLLDGEIVPNGYNLGGITGKKFYNNGIKTVLTFERPEGFVDGCIKRKKYTRNCIDKPKECPKDRPKIKHISYEKSNNSYIFLIERRGTKIKKSFSLDKYGEQAAYDKVLDLSKAWAGAK